MPLMIFNDVGYLMRHKPSGAYQWCLGDARAVAQYRGGATETGARKPHLNIYGLPSKSLANTG